MKIMTEILDNEQEQRIKNIFVFICIIALHKVIM